MAILELAVEPTTELVHALVGGKAARIISYMAIDSRDQGIRTANYLSSLSLRDLTRIALMDSRLSTQRLAQAVKADLYKVDSVFL